MSQSESPKRGKVHPKKTLFLRELVAEAELGEGKYEMLTSMARAPMIMSKQTGKYFTLSWQDILELAIEGGIDAED